MTDSTCTPKIGRSAPWPRCFFWQRARRFRHNDRTIEAGVRQERHDRADSQSEPPIKLNDIAGLSAASVNSSITTYPRYWVDGSRLRSGRIFDRLDKLH